MYTKGLHIIVVVRLLICVYVSSYKQKQPKTQLKIACDHCNHAHMWKHLNKTLKDGSWLYHILLPVACKEIQSQLLVMYNNKNVMRIYTGTNCEHTANRGSNEKHPSMN